MYFNSKRDVLRGKNHVYFVYHDIDRNCVNAICITEGMSPRYSDLIAISCGLESFAAKAVIDLTKLDGFIFTDYND